jgi:hypothetical protein
VAEQLGFSSNVVQSILAEAEIHHPATAGQPTFARIYRLDDAEQSRHERGASTVNAQPSQRPTASTQSNPSPPGVEPGLGSAEMDTRTVVEILRRMEARMDRLERMLERALGMEGTSSSNDTQDATMTTTTTVQ